MKTAANSTRSPSDSRPDWDKLIEYLAKTKNGARGGGKMAALDRALREYPEHVPPEALAIVIPHVRPSRRSQDAGVITAGLYARWHTGYNVHRNGRNNMGGCLGLLDDQRARDRHIAKIIDPDPMTLSVRLSSAVKILSDHGICPNWSELHRDVSAILQGYPEPVQRRWLTRFNNPIVKTSTPDTAS